MSTNFVLGMDAKLYIGDPGSTAATEMSNVRDVTLNLEVASADVTTRGDGGWRVNVPTLRDASLTFQMVWDPEDANFVKVRNAYLPGTDTDAVAFLVLDKEGGQGFDADFMIESFTRNEELENAVMADVTARPARSTRAPSWYGV